jgi:hypothetical protein
VNVEDNRYADQTGRLRRNWNASPHQKACAGRAAFLALQKINNTAGVFFFVCERDNLFKMRFVSERSGWTILMLGQGRFLLSFYVHPAAGINQIFATQGSLATID